MKQSGLLKSLRARLGGWLASRVAASVIAVVGLLALAAVLLDAAVDLPEWIRAGAPWMVAGIAAVVTGAGIRQWRRLSERRVARLLEQVNPSLGNRLINAVELAHGESISAVQEHLRREAVELGRRASAGLRTAPIARPGMTVALGLLACVGIAWTTIGLLEADLIRTVLPRFLDPHGDHPPFSRLKIEVTPREGEVIYGGQLEVRATTSGRPADKLWLAMRSETNETRSIMFLAPDKSFFQTLANLREPAEYFVTDGAARSRRYPIRIRYTPRITQVELAAEFPEYTGKSAKAAKLGDESEAFPEGTRLSFRVTSNRPLKSGALDLTPVLGGAPERVVLQCAAQDTVVTGQFVLHAPVAFSLSISDVDGLESTEPRRGRFNLLPDEKPRLFVLEPGRHAVATPEIRVPVRVQASDDYGVAQVTWLRSHNRSIERPFNMPLTLRSGPALVEAAGSFDLDRLGVRPGDVIEYYFEAADNDPKGPNIALSRPYRLEIISKEQYELVLRQAAARKALFEPYFRLGTWLNRLAERSRALESQTAQSETAARQEARDLADQLQQYERELGRLLQAAVLFDIEESFRAELVMQHTRISQTRSRLQKALEAGQLNPDEMKEISDEMNRLAAAERENVGDPVRHITSVVRLLARADAFVRMAQQQSALAQMLRRFATQTNALSRLEEMEVREFAHQQRRIQEGLRALTAELPELLGQVPPDAEYDALRRDVNAFLEAVAAAEIEGDLSLAAGALDEPDTITGYGLALQAAEKMDRLIARCESLADSGIPCLEARFRPSLAQAGMGAAVRQILAALGAGDGGDGRDGYGLFNEDVALYGPGLELAGEQAGGRGEPGESGARRVERVAADADDPGLNHPEIAGRVRLQPHARFPMRYRDLVGEYFRAIAESAEEGE